MTTVEWEPIPSELNVLSGSVVDAAYRVHSQLGPGLLESVYSACLVYELRKRGHSVETEVHLPIVYESMKLDAGLRLDIVVERRLVIEIKAVNDMNPVFEAQLITYLKLSRLRLGLLINFNVQNISDGILRRVR